MMNKFWDCESSQRTAKVRVDFKNLPAETAIHFIGIGGVSMSGLAEICAKRGMRVSGSDASEGPMLDKLRGMGVKVLVGHDGANIGDADLIIFTAAISEDNPELVAARRSAALVVDRASFLGAVMGSYQRPSAIAGTHGKTTTTGMVAHILLGCDLSPTISIGGNLPLIGGNIKVGESEYFLTEACEYCESFLSLRPLVCAILNIEEDHLDYYKDLDHIISSFNKLVQLLPPEGFVIANYDDPNVKKALANAQCGIVTYGLNGGDFTATNVLFDSFNCASFDLVKGGETQCHVQLSVPGTHNVSNAMAALAIADSMRLPLDMAAEALSAFAGVERRFQRKCNVNGALLIDDYAHHPTEIQSTIQAAKAISTGDIYVIFQPHTYSRTLALFDDFVKVFSDDEIKVVITDIYAAREIDDGRVSGKKLADAVKGARYIQEFEDCASFIRQNAKEGDVVITMGAGNVVNICELLNN